MKKLMFAAVAALACTAFAEETAPVTEIPSENIVGYTNIELVKGWNMLALNFEDIGNAEGISIQDLIPGTTEGLTANMNGTLADQIQVYDPVKGGYTIYFLYYTTLPVPALQEKNYKWVNAQQAVSDYKFKPGDTFWYRKAGDTTVSVAFKGQVSKLEKQEITIVPGWNMIGNQFPANFNPNALGTEYWSTCGATANMNGTLADQIQVYDPVKGGYTIYFLYYTTLPVPALQEKNYKWVNATQTPIDTKLEVLKPGNGVWYKHVGSGFKLTIPTPIAPEEK